MTTNGTLGAMNGKFPPEKRASDQIKRVAAVDIGVVERLLRRKNAAGTRRHQKRLPVSAEGDPHALFNQLQKPAAKKLRRQRPRHDAVKLPVHPGDIDLNQNFFAVHSASSHCFQSIFSVSFGILPSSCRADG